MDDNINIHSSKVNMIYEKTGVFLYANLIQAQSLLYRKQKI